MDLRAAFIIIVLVASIILFLLRLRYFIRYSRMKRQIQQDKEFFLKHFDPSKFTDFDTFNFQLWSFSHVEPFPTRNDGEWRYTMYFVRSEAEDIDTIVHEITECTVGRLIEKLLQLKKPLYMIRKQEDKFWLSGQQQKYLPEHLVTTFSELGNITREKLQERMALQDIEKWHLLGSQIERSN